MKTIKIGEARRNFGSIFARAKRGELIVLQNGSDYLQLVPCAVPEAVPIHPVGHFRHTDEEVERINATQPDRAPVR